MDLIGNAVNDTLRGGADADTFLVDDSFGNDTFVGGDTGTDADTIDLSALTSGVNITVSAVEAGTITDGNDTITGLASDTAGTTSTLDGVPGTTSSMVGTRLT